MAGREGTRRTDDSRTAIFHISTIQFFSFVPSSLSLHPSIESRRRLPFHHPADGPPPPFFLILLLQPVTRSFLASAFSALPSPIVPRGPIRMVHNYIGRIPLLSHPPFLRERCRCRNQILGPGHEASFPRSLAAPIEKISARKALRSPSPCSCFASTRRRFGRPRPPSSVSERRT